MMLEPGHCLRADGPLRQLRFRSATTGDAGTTDGHSHTVQLWLLARWSAVLPLPVAHRGPCAGATTPQSAQITKSLLASPLRGIQCSAVPRDGGSQQHHPKPQVVVPVVRMGPVAVGGASVAMIVAPRPAPHHPANTRFGLGILPPIVRPVRVRVLGYLALVVTGAEQTRCPLARIAGRVRHIERAVAIREHARRRRPLHPRLVRVRSQRIPLVPPWVTPSVRPPRRRLPFHFRR